jgi:hypothetical protein
VKVDAVRLPAVAWQGVERVPPVRHGSGNFLSGSRKNVGDLFVTKEQPVVAVALHIRGGAS